VLTLQCSFALLARRSIKQNVAALVDTHTVRALGDHTLLFIPGRDTPSHETRIFHAVVKVAFSCWLWTNSCYSSSSIGGSYCEPFLQRITQVAVSRKTISLCNGGCRFSRNLNSSFEKECVKCGVASLVRELTSWGRELGSMFKWSRVPRMFHTERTTPFLQSITANPTTSV
jgi:hypothetical protein